MRIVFEHYFDAAHKLPDSEDLVTKKCTNLHGHTYKVILELEGTPAKSGLLTDYAVIKETIDVLDHKYLNDIMELTPTTAENVAIFLKQLLADNTGLKVNYVGVCEGWKGKDIYAYA